MRVLWLSNETPDLHGQGGQRRQYAQIESLVKWGDEVTVCSLTGPQSDESVRQLAPVMRAQPRLRGRLPNPVDRLARRKLFRRDWDRVVVAHTESWSTWRDELERCEVPLLVDMHNVVSAWHRHQGRESEAAQWRRVEAEIVCRAAAIAVCSRRERDRFQDEHHFQDVIVLSHGVDPDDWSREPSPSDQPVVKLFGNWDWEPNRAGLLWFMSHVWPAVSSRAHARCVVAGNGAPDVPEARGVRFLGRVPSIPDFLQDAWVVAVPVMGGVGAPVKFAEALASGVPLAVTEDGALRDGGTWFVSDDPDEWGRWISEVIRSPSLHRADALATRRFALRELNWETVNAPLIRWVAAPAVETQ